MDDTFKNVGKSIIISLMLAASSAFIGIYIGHLFQSSDIHVTILQFDNANEQKSKVYGILQNVGSAQAKDLILVFNYPHKYQLISYNSTESIPKIIDSIDGILRISIDRLSPQSYLILTLTSDSSKLSSYSIWLTADDSTKFLTIPPYKKNFGISDIPFIIPELPSLGAGSLVGIGLFSMIRYVLYTKSESLRKNYLGVYNIKITKFNFRLFFYCCMIIGVFFIASASTVGFLENRFSYTPNTVFTIDDKITPEQFIQLQKQDNSSGNPANTGYFILFIGIAIALVCAIRDIKIPTFIWLLKPRSISTVPLNKISSSFYKVKEVTIDYKIEDDWEEYDFYALKEKNRISGLVAKIELGDNPKNKTIKSILTKRNLPIPKWNEVEMYRDNFYLAEDSLTLGELKIDLEKNIKRYAAVIGSNQELLGILDYESIFKNED